MLLNEKLIEANLNKLKAKFEIYLWGFIFSNVNNDIIWIKVTSDFNYVFFLSVHRYWKW